MELSKNRQNTSYSCILESQNSQSSDSKSESNKLYSKLNYSSSFDSENYQDSSLDISNFSNDKHKDDNQNNSGNKPKKLSSIPENENEEQSSMVKIEIEPKKHFIKLITSPQQNGEKIINKLPLNGVISPKFCCEIENGNKETFFIDKKNEFSENKNNVNKGVEIEVSDDQIKMMSNQCICSGSSCRTF